MIAAALSLLALVLSVGLLARDEAAADDAETSR
jgi:hypothetical protein